MTTQGKIPSMTWEQAREKVREKADERAAGMTAAEREKALEEMARKWGHSRAVSGGDGSGKDAAGADRKQGDGSGKRTLHVTPAQALALKGTRKNVREIAEVLKNSPEVEERPAPAGLPEQERTPPNKFENNFMIDLMLLRNALRVRGPKVKERLKKVNKHAARDLGLLFSLVDRLQVQLASTMPASRDEYYTILARNGRYHLTVDGPIRQGHTVLVTDTNLAYLCEVAVEQECLTCLRDGSEIRQCPLRKALMEIAPAMEMKADPGERCEYANVHRQLMHGEDVTI